MARRWSLCALAVVAAAAAGCGGDDGKPAAARNAGATTTASSNSQAGIERAGSVAQLADCGDWRKADEKERQRIIKDVRSQNTPQRSSPENPPLPAERAYQIFERFCAPRFPATLRLYLIYARAQAFAPLSE